MSTSAAEFGDRTDALRFLVQAGELLPSSLDYHQTLDSIVRLAVPRLADLVLIDLLQPDGSFRREHSVHVDPSKEEAVRVLARFSRIDENARTSPTAHAIATGEPVFMPDAPDQFDEERFDAEHLRILRFLHVRSLISAPLLVRGTVLGAITLAYSERDSHYDESHLDMVVELARRAAVAIDHALLFGAAEEARIGAERSKASLQAMVTAIDQLIIELDSDGRYLTIAPTVAPIMWRAPEELLGRTLDEVFPPEIARSFQESIRRALDERRSVELEYNLPIFGRTVWFAGSVSPIGADRVVWVVRDVTNRKMAEEALAESEERFRATFDQAAVGISHVALNGQFNRVNQRLCDVVGYTREELLRLTFQDITHPSDRASHIVQAERLLTGEIDSYRIEKRYVRKSGESIWVAVTESLVRKESGEPDYYISVVEDVHERKALEEQLIRAQKIEAVGRLAGGVAHEFNNALTTITGFAELALRAVSAHDPVRPDIEEISRAAWRAAGVANRLMVFSSNQISQPEVLDLGGVVAGAERMLSQLTGENVELLVNLHREATPVHADRRQLEQVVVNLAMNARDAMPSGGQLMIETAVVEVDADSARRLGDLPAGSYVLLTVSDTGEGMADEIKGRIFDPFFTTKDPEKGTGLGLSIVYGIVRKAGGAVEVDSEIGLGTTFRIWLPQAAAPHRGVVVVGDRPGDHNDNDRILLVEDDAGVRSLAERVLRRLGYEVIVASSAEEALSKASRELGRIDLLLTDLVMPGMNGRELAETMAKLQPGLPVLFTSGYSSDEMVRRGVAQDRKSFIEKPFSPEELERAVRRALDR